MAIVKEWTCMAHGAFDGYEQKCPHGCGASMVVRAFRTAPSIQSAGYRGINATMNSLAAEHGLTNMNTRSAIQDGTGQRRADHATYQRLTQATQIVMNASRSGQQGLDAGQYFKPLSEYRPGSGGGGALQAEGGTLAPMHEGSDVMIRSGGQITAGGIPLAPPQAQVVAAHDGRNAGLPE